MSLMLSGEAESEDGSGPDAIETSASCMAAGLGNLVGSAAGSATPVVSKMQIRLTN